MLVQAQRLMIRHGLIVILIGLLGGFFLAFNLLKEIAPLPLPWSIKLEIPGDPAKWRAVHTGNILNGFLAIIYALVLPHLALTDRLIRWTSVGLVAVVYGNAAFYIFGVMAPNRGLSVAGNRFGEGDIFGFLAFLPAYIVAFVATIMMIRAVPGPDQT